MRVAYFDVFAGASGDMILGSLLDTGLRLEPLKDVLKTIPLTGWDLEQRTELRGAIGGTRALVTIDNPVDQPERHRNEILALVNQSALSQRVKSQVGLVFDRLAEAEARVHRSSPELVHFHEVGAVDSIIDIVGAVAGLEMLGVEQVYVSSIPLGGGWARSRHGRIPVPAPATIELLASAQAPVRPSEGSAAGKEMVTPTAAALFVALGVFDQPTLRVDQVGYGIGGRDLPDVPNALRVWLGELSGDSVGLRLIETNIDDLSPEILGYVLERLLASGARDAWFTPIHMKKNRPATMISVICDAAAERRLADLLLRETSTLGVRVQPIRRHEAERASLDVITPLGPAVVKVKRIAGVIAGVSPEYEVCRRLAEQHSLPLPDVYRIVESAARAVL